MPGEEFRKQVKDALEHLYDTAHLQVHPLVRWVGPQAGPDQLSRAQRLRGLLKDGIEALRPQGTVDNSPPEWRPYVALTLRYVRGMSMDHACEELGISLRQLQRELHRGLDALADLLAERYGEAVEAQTAADRGPLPELAEELSRWPLTRAPILVQTLLDEPLSMLAPLLDGLGVELTVRIAPDLPPAHVDATLTRQAVVKLVRLLAVDSGCALTVEARPGAAEVVISLSCPACNPSAADEPLQLAELLVGKQDGRLLLQTAPDGATEILLNLPGARRARVLVVDDNEAIHQLFERYLTPHHYEVLHASNGAEALRMAEELRPDAVTLDVMMPNVDGWQVLRRLSGGTASAGMPVVICSVLREPELAYALGARAYLKKPVDRLDLLTTLARLLNDEETASAAHPPAPQGT